MFRILLFCAGFFLKIIYIIASALNNDFKRRILERNMIILVKAGRKKAVQYALEYGHIHVRFKDHADPDIAVLFSSALAAYMMVLRPTPRLMIKSFMNAVINGKMKFEFKAESVSWLMITLYKLVNTFINRTQAIKT